VLTSLIIKRFKSVNRVELKTGKINLFIGANRTGKSTVFQAMHILKDLL
jgi:predicted ATPase